MRWKKIKTPKGGKKKNEFLLGSGRHTLLQTLVCALACSGLQMCVTAAWAYLLSLFCNCLPKQPFKFINLSNRNGSEKTSHLFR